MRTVVKGTSKNRDCSHFPSFRRKPEAPPVGDPTCVLTFFQCPVELRCSFFLSCVDKMPEYETDLPVTMPVEGVAAEIIDERDIQPKDDQQIRELLCLCFPGWAEIFRQHRRWHNTSPIYSVIVRASATDQNEGQTSDTPPLLCGRSRRRGISATTSPVSKEFALHRKNVALVYPDVSSEKQCKKPFAGSFPLPCCTAKNFWCPSIRRKAGNWRTTR